MSISGSFAVFLAAFRYGSDRSGIFNLLRRMNLGGKYFGLVKRRKTRGNTGVAGMRKASMALSRLSGSRSERISHQQLSLRRICII
jgi:hypothetical protein